MRGKLLHLTLLGALVGLASAVAVLAFRWLIEVGQAQFLPDGRVGNYEALPGWAVFALPTLGGLVLGLAYGRLPPALREVGIVHVLRQLRHTGRPEMPYGNALVQFFAGAFAIVCGHSVDREGPGVHLGAAAGTLVGHRSDESDTYTLTVCGAGAAIAAAFNTPLAGVMFLVEVLGVNYRIDRFVPIITASVTGAVISRLAFGEEPSLLVYDLGASPLRALPLLALLGLLTGALAVLFVTATERTARFARLWPPALAYTCAGAFTGLIGLGYPQVLGVGYDTLNAILANHLGGALLAGLMLAKLLATAVSVGLRIPGGLIGPSLVIGGAAGGLIGVAAPPLLGFSPGSESFFAAVGMVAMMGAVLQAPLAALTALLELTGDPDIILPGMTAVIIADLVMRQVWNKESIFGHLRRINEPRED
jgi:chloride channel protein, CIC family